MDERKSPPALNEAEMVRRLTAQVRVARKVSSETMVPGLIRRAVELGALPELADTIAVIDRLSEEELAAGWSYDSLSIRKATTREPSYNTSANKRPQEAQNAEGTPDAATSETPCGDCT